MQKEIKLKGGAIVEVDFIEVSKCRSCGKMIWWAKTKNGKNMLISVVGKQLKAVDEKDSFESHFASCKQADKWRK